jgi:hypothetical protein
MFGAAVDAIDLGEAFRRECAGPPWYAALVLRLSLWMAWLSPIWLGRRSAGGVHRRRLATFGALDRDAREAMLEAMLSSPRYVVRATAFYFKLTACLALLGDERVFRRIGAYEHGRLPMLEERT